ncbi:hypothetical protein [Nocardia sp. NBC_00416]|uniref:hypothetical protein n=1 Tax=Nocardia sp. NBC_00416 TaxID=2975991 RepID=UPI002E24CA17
MQRKKTALVAAALAMLCATSSPAGADPAAPNAGAAGMPQEFSFMQRGDPERPACIYYNEVAAGRGDAVDGSTCRSDESHVFTRLLTDESYLRLELTDHFGKCLIGDTSTNPGVVVVGSCDDPRADWIAGGTIDPPNWAFAPRSNHQMYLRDNGIALVLQNTETPLSTPGYYWNLI